MYAEVASLTLTPDTPAVVRNSVALAMAPKVDSEMLTTFKATETQWVNTATDLEAVINAEISQSKELLKSLFELFISVGATYQKGSEAQKQIMEFTQVLNILDPKYLETKRRKFLFFSATPSIEEYYSEFQKLQEPLQTSLADFAQLATKITRANVDLQASKARLWGMLIRLHAIYLICAETDNPEITEKNESAKNRILELLAHSLDTYLYLDYSIRVNQVQIQRIKLLSEKTFEFLFLAKQLSQRTKYSINLEKIVPLDANTALASTKPNSENLNFADLENGYLVIQELLRSTGEFYCKVLSGINELVQRWRERHGNI